MAIDLPALEGQGEWLLTVSFTLAEAVCKRWPATAWLGITRAAGEQSRSALSAEAGGKLEITQDADSLTVRGGGFSVAFGKKTGEMVSFKFAGRELLVAPLAPNFWKVPNDNQYRSSYLKTVAPRRRRGGSAVESLRNRRFPAEL